MKRVFSTLVMLACTTMMNANYSASFAQTTGEIAKGNCESTAKMCQKAMDYCNEKKGKYSDSSVTNAIKDCMSACKSTDDFLRRGSKLSSKSSALCAEACTECAKACDQFKDDLQMTSLANECRKSIGNLSKVDAK